MAKNNGENGLQTEVQKVLEIIRTEDQRLLYWVRLARSVFWSAYVLCIIFLLIVFWLRLSLSTTFVLWLVGVSAISIATTTPRIIVSIAEVGTAIGVPAEGDAIAFVRGILSGYMRFAKIAIGSYTVAMLALMVANQSEAQWLIMPIGMLTVIWLVFYEK